jgi:hypothetical protein
MVAAPFVVHGPELPYNSFTLSPVEFSAGNDFIRTPLAVASDT